MDATLPKGKLVRLNGPNPQLGLAGPLACVAKGLARQTVAGCIQICLRAPAVYQRQAAASIWTTAAPSDNRAMAMQLSGNDCKLTQTQVQLVYLRCSKLDNRSVERRLCCARTSCKRHR